MEEKNHLRDSPALLNPSPLSWETQSSVSCNSRVRDQWPGQQEWRAMRSLLLTIHPGYVSERLVGTLK